MARKYPRFLLSTRTDSKNDGTFIVHTIYPKCILKVVFQESDSFNIELVDWLEDVVPFSTDNTPPELGIIKAAGIKLFNKLKSNKTQP